MTTSSGKVVPPSGEPGNRTVLLTIPQTVGPQGRGQLDKSSWHFLRSFNLPPEHDSGNAGWGSISDWIASAGRAACAAEAVLERLFVWWDERLQELGGDASQVQWDDFRPLRLSREEDWSDWLAQLLQTSTTGTFARDLFLESLGSAGGDFIAPQVARELSAKPKPRLIMEVSDRERRRADLLVRWQSGAISHVEIKVGDEAFDKTFETAKWLCDRYENGKPWTDHVLIPDASVPAWQDCVERHPHERTFQVLTWTDVARALRRSLLAPESVLWRVWAYSFSGAVEQKLLGHRCRRDRSLKPIATRLKTYLDAIELLLSARGR